MASRNEINIRTNSGRYLFDVSSFTKRSNPEVQERKKICYARVSRRGQKPDLENQISLLKTRFPDSEVYNIEIHRDINGVINIGLKHLESK